MIDVINCHIMMGKDDEKIKLGQNGRIVIPKSIRKEMNVEAGSPLIITFKKGEVIVRSDQSTCGLCRSPIESGRLPRLCDKCMGEVLKYHSPNSKN